MAIKDFGFTVRFHIEADDRRDVDDIFREALEAYAARVAVSDSPAPPPESEQGGDEYYTVEEVTP